MAAYIGLLALFFPTALPGDSPRQAESNGKLFENPAAASAHEFKKQGKLQFITGQQRLLTTIDIEIADAEWKRSLGLMYREKMAANQGMLFVFEEEAPRSFWMKNTRISLDMIFANAERKIVTILRNTTPYSEQLYTSHKPAMYVVEVNAGFSAMHGIAVGDKISWS